MIKEFLKKLGNLFSIFLMAIAGLIGRPVEDAFLNKPGERTNRGPILTVTTPEEPGSVLHPLQKGLENIHDGLADSGEMARKKLDDDIFSKQQEASSMVAADDDWKNKTKKRPEDETDEKNT